MKTTKIAGNEYIFEDYGQNFSCTLNGTESGDVVTLRLRMDFGKKVRPKKASLRFCRAALSADGVWTACGGMNRRLTPDWAPATVSIRSVTEYPVLSVVSFDDINVCTFCVKDAEKPCLLKAGYREEDSVIVYEAEWFTDVTEETECYETEILIDFRSVHFAETVGCMAELLAKKYDLKPAPDSAFKPAFSTWYCFHQEVYRERFLKECREAKKLGLDVVILDDGWQTDDNSRGYGYSGDYHPAKTKIGDICTLTEEIRSIGLKSIIWFSLAFSGDFAKSTERFNQMSLYHDNELNAYVVDSRFREVRAHIVDYCTEAIRDWGFDGLKLDFIDSFCLTEESVLREGTDCASIEEGIRRLSDELNKSLRAVKKDILIEFRQRYIGPVMQRLGNMLRVGDCPGSLLQNRVSLIDLRLIAGERAVHADPLEWQANERAENIARYFINVIFATLQYSVFPSGLNEAQRAVSERYIRFMKEYEDVLQHGKLLPRGVLSNYVSCKAWKNRNAVVALYADVSAEIHEERTVVLNGGTRDRILLDTNGKTYAYRTENCFGNLIGEGEINGFSSIYVPVGGFAYLMEI